jgi:Protein of unknown function (DUF3551)
VQRVDASPAKEAFMRTIVLVTAALVALPLTSIRAHADGAWCARDTRGGTNCGFHTYAQCQADIRGIGGSCDPNQAFQTYNRGYQTYSRDARQRARDWQY